MFGIRSGIVVALGLLALAPSARAQFSPFDANFGNNPFSAYYGYYIPRQQSIAAQRAYSSTATLNLNAAERRATALTTRRADTLYGPSSIYDVSPLEERSFVRPPTVLLPGQPATPRRGGYFGRTSSQYISGVATGAPGSVRAPSNRIPENRYGRPRNFGGGFGGGGFGGGGFGGGFGGGLR